MINNPLIGILSVIKPIAKSHIDKYIDIKVEQDINSIPSASSV